MRLNHVHVGVTEIERSVDFYRRLGLEQIVASDDYARLALPEGEQSIPLDAIKKAKLVLTDDLIAAAQMERRS